MPPGLKVAIGQHSSAGVKPVNQDHHGARVPMGALLASKGVALALADGIGSSEVSHEASATAVRGFLTDYFDTSDAWSVKRSAYAVISAVNAWLHARNHAFRHDLDRGHVCTFSALVIKSRTAHVLHVGDSRIGRIAAASPGKLEPLTRDHRLHAGGGITHLARALGISPQVEIDYLAVPLAAGDVFVLSTDGVHDVLGDDETAAILAHHGQDLDAAARALIEQALGRGSQDNLTCQIARIEHLPEGDAAELHRQVAVQALPPPPPLRPRMAFEGYTIVRTLHESHRSHIHLVRDDVSGRLVALKAPATDLQGDAAQMDRFLLEEWIARRIDNPHVLKAMGTDRPRRHAYVVMEHVEGQTLAQWMIDHPRPGLETVRGIVEQIARGLQAFHRMEMLHQDLRPENIMIDPTGTVRIIDFGAVHVAGVAESEAGRRLGGLVGSVQFAAPEYFLGEPGTPRSDLFSLATLAYLMLTGRLPYGAAVTRVRSHADLPRLRYRSALDDRRSDLPAWVDEVLRKALQPRPGKRHEALSAFVHELRHPPAAYLARRGRSLIERDPLRFWKTTSAVLALLALLLLALIVHRS